MDILSSFLNSIPRRILPEFGFTAAQVDLVCDDIRRRLRSLLSRWYDEPFRRTVLFLGLEEATFYEPAGAPLDVRCLVVVTFRNSLIEDFASTEAAAKRHGAPGPLLRDADMQLVTAPAVAFLAATDLGEEWKHVSPPPTEDDVFGVLPSHYPAAWAALSQLAALTGRQRDLKYRAVSCVAPAIPLDDAADLGKARSLRVAYSGIDPSFDAGLASLLRAVGEGTALALFPCFKGCSRNPDKLLKVIEFVLCQGTPFATPNVYLDNGYVARRRELLRPVPGRGDIEPLLKEHVRSRRGLARRHRAMLKVYEDALNMKSGA